MKVFGLVGWSGSGKTTLLVRLLPVLASRGLRISTIKHAHHRFDVDQPGKDSYEHRRAGAVEVLVSSAQRWALMHELRDEAEPELPELLSRLSPVDLVLVEGFKRHPHAKLEVWRAALGQPPLSAADDSVVALAGAGRAPPGARLPYFDLDDVAGIAGFIQRHVGLWPD
jgi:molybdopterin-guanine dinucleotide biosynthesis protein B